MSHQLEKTTDDTCNAFIKNETEIFEMMSENDIKLEILDGNFEISHQVTDLQSIKEEKYDYTDVKGMLENKTMTNNREIDNLNMEMNLNAPNTSVGIQSAPSPFDSYADITYPSAGHSSETIVQTQSDSGSKMSKRNKKSVRKKTTDSVIPKQFKRRRAKKDDITFSCGICSKTFAKSKDFFSHMTLHRKVKKSKYDIENKERNKSVKSQKKSVESKAIGSTARQINKSEAAKSKIDGQIIKDEPIMFEYKFKTQNVEQVPEKQHCDNKKKRTAKHHQCDVCGGVFTFHGNLVRHKLKHTGGRVTCDICKNTYNSKSYLIEHMKVVHLKIKKDTIFTCKVCKKTVTTAYALRWHMQTHSGYKPFRCNICMKDFSNKWNLKVHSKVHT